MAQLLKGAPVAAAVTEETKKITEALRAWGTVPVLALLRTGERPEDGSYIAGILKKADAAGIEVRQTLLPADVPAERFYETLSGLNADPAVHGILMFRPLPRQIDDRQARALLSPEKDVDGCTELSLAGVFTGAGEGFCPCTAEAAMEMLSFYGIDPTGRNAAVVGRSLVIGRPAAMLLMHRNATVTVCHSKTPDLASVTRRADIVVAALGKTEFLTGGYFAPGQTVIDVGIGWNEKKQKLCGDVCFDEAEPVVSAITPVPGGVGSVTTAVLLRHCALAALKKSES